MSGFILNFTIVDYRCDFLDIAADDYAIMVSNIPKKFEASDYDEYIKYFFEGK